MNRLAVAVLFAAIAASPALAREKPAPKTWKDALAVLRKAETVDDAAVGPGGVKSENYKAFEVLRDGAPTDALVKLTDDEDPEIRCYAFRALVARQRDVDLTKLVAKHFGDLATVQTFRGCIVGGETVGDVMLADLQARVSDGQRTDLARLIVFGEVKLQRRAELLQTFVFPREDLPRLRKLHDDGDSGALVAIARLRDPEDLARITKALRAPPAKVLDVGDGFRAAAIHPDPAHLPLLLRFEPAVTKQLPELKNPHRFRSWLSAVAAHDTDESAAVLARFLDVPLPSYVTRRRTELVFSLAKAGDRARRTDLFWKLWIEHRVLDAEVIGHLDDADGARLREQAEKDLRGHVNELPPGAVGPLLDVLRIADRDKANAVLTDALAEIQVGNARAALSRAAEWTEAAHVEPLFELYANSNPHVYAAAARALLAYDDPKIDARLEKTSEREGWGGKRLRRILDAKPRTWEAGRDL